MNIRSLRSVGFKSTGVVLGAALLLVLHGGCGSRPSSGAGGKQVATTCGDGTCGAGETCETCPDDCGSCACLPDCTGRACGPDPQCGVSCGSCQSGSACDDTGQCACVQECGGRECGPDPRCKQSCGECQAGQTCNASGKCECVPDCSGVECGPDPNCGVSCGSCNPGFACDGSGSCACVPQCGGRQCGADPSCGTSCGVCPSGQICNASGQCEVPPIACPSCSGSSACGGGEVCAQRYCDGLSGCYGTSPGAYCTTIAGAPCPPTPMYWPCTTDSDCGGGDYLCRFGFCTAQCSGSLQMPYHPCAPPNPNYTSGVTAHCVYTDTLCGPSCESTTDGPYFCALACTAASQCPPGTSCQGGYCR